MACRPGSGRGMQFLIMQPPACRRVLAVSPRRRWHALFTSMYPQAPNMQVPFTQIARTGVEMPATPSPTARARRLRHELRRLREEAGLTHSEVAHRLEWSPSKLSRIETGQSRVQTGDVRDLLEVYGITDQATYEALVQLAREARR